MRKLSQKSFRNCAPCLGTLIPSPHGSTCRTFQWSSGSQTLAPIRIPWKGLLQHRLLASSRFWLSRSWVMLRVLFWESHLQGYCIRVTPPASPGPSLTPTCTLLSYELPIRPEHSSQRPPCIKESGGGGSEACGCSLPLPGKVTCWQAHGGMTQSSLSQ